MQKPDIVVIGFSGNAREALETIEHTFQVVSFLDDRPELHNTLFDGIPVLATAHIADFPSASVVCLIGSEHSFRRRAEIISRFNLEPQRFATAVHPRANVSRFASVGNGVVVLAGVCIMPGAVVGNHVVILPNSVIHHDTRIGDYSLVGSNVVIAGNVTVGTSCYLGSGSTIKNGLSIGEGSLVGLGANVLRNIDANQVVVGNPARVLAPR